MTAPEKREVDTIIDELEAAYRSLDTSPPKDLAERLRGIEERRIAWGRLAIEAKRGR